MVRADEYFFFSRAIIIFPLFQYFFFGWSVPGRLGKNNWDKDQVQQCKCYHTSDRLATTSFMISDPVFVGLTEDTSLFPPDIAWNQNCFGEDREAASFFIKTDSIDIDLYLFRQIVNC